MGFSPHGLVLSIALFAPSLLLVRFPPHPAPTSVGVPRSLVALERVGQVLCVTVPVITVGGDVRWWWALPVSLLVVAYGALWIRFVAGGCRLDLLFGPVWGIPVPMAVLPVAAFLAGSAWLANPWMAVAAVVLAAGHLPSSLFTARTL
ncbi:hypothetical protein DEU37_2643 [Microbacterium sp. AG790]|uniref:hypothetical protein n=1 Tax=Microbacterium sp. AG790 TaxID=2183995 RepID=UPI000EAFC1A3|nr:hypothetical protein [Microbacterium sp. AG790]RKS86277.1 hypothetical protein DEU37_2643 [Microbacterium sp. AG790]